jgi:hypothetical protein
MPLKMTSRVQATIYVDIAARKSSSSTFELFLLIVYFGFSSSVSSESLSEDPFRR